MTRIHGVALLAASVLLVSTEAHSDGEGRSAPYKLHVFLANLDGVPLRGLDSFVSASLVQGGDHIPVSEDLSAPPGPGGVRPLRAQPLAGQALRTGEALLTVHYAGGRDVTIPIRFAGERNVRLTVMDGDAPIRCTPRSQSTVAAMTGSAAQALKGYYNARRMTISTPCSDENRGEVAAMWLARSCEVAAYYPHMVVDGAAIIHLSSRDRARTNLAEMRKRCRPAHEVRPREGLAR